MIVASHTWTGTDGKLYQVWADGRSWMDTTELKLPRPVVDEILRLRGETVSDSTAAQVAP